MDLKKERSKKMQNNEQFIQEYMEKVLSFLKVNVSCSIEQQDEGYVVDITGDRLNFLIGKQGLTLNSLQYLLTLSLFTKTQEWVDIVVDINDYRKIKKEKLENLAKKLIDEARFSEEPVTFPLMTAFERKQVHEFIAQYDDITSHSEGEGEERRLIVEIS